MNETANANGMTRNAIVVYSSSIRYFEKSNCGRIYRNRNGIAPTIIPTISTLFVDALSGAAAATYEWMRFTMPPPT